jgi:hypothetical protein
MELAPFIANADEHIEHILCQTMYMNKRAFAYFGEANPCWRPAAIIKARQRYGGVD